MDFHFSSNNFSFFSLGSNLFLRVYFFNYLFSGDLLAILGLWLLLFFLKRVYSGCLLAFLEELLFDNWDVASAALVRFLCLTKIKRAEHATTKMIWVDYLKLGKKGQKERSNLLKIQKNSHDDGKCAGH